MFNSLLSLCSEQMHVILHKIRLRDSATTSVRTRTFVAMNAVSKPTAQHHHKLASSVLLKLLGFILFIHFGMCVLCMCVCLWVCKCVSLNACVPACVCMCVHASFHGEGKVGVPVAQKRQPNQDPTFSSHLKDLRSRCDTLTETPVKRLRVRAALWAHS